VTDFSAGRVVLVWHGRLSPIRLRDDEFRLGEMTLDAARQPRIKRLRRWILATAERHARTVVKRKGQFSIAATP